MCNQFAGVPVLEANPSQKFSGALPKADLSGKLVKQPEWYQKTFLVLGDCQADGNANTRFYGEACWGLYARSWHTPHSLQRARAQVALGVFLVARPLRMGMELRAFMRSTALSDF